MSHPSLRTSSNSSTLREGGDGNPDAADRLLPLIYPELRRQAARYLRCERPNHTLQPTALVHEAYLKLVGKNVPWENRTQFFSAAARAMRQILVDYARRRGREKRGGAGSPASFEEAFFIVAGEKNLDLVALDEALSRLATIEEDQARIVELRYFSGLTLDEAAVAMGISRSTAARYWRFAKAWLRRELTR